MNRSVISQKTVSRLWPALVVVFVPIVGAVGLGLLTLGAEE